MRAILLAGSLCLVAVAVSASITNVTKIAELSTAGIADWEPRISSDERTIVFRRWDSPIDDTRDRYFVATRTSPTAAFDTPTTAPFVNVLSSSSEGFCWMSDDGLRFYFSSTRGGTGDLFYTERVSTADPFPAPSLMSVSDPVAHERCPVLASNELSLYFISDRTGGAYWASTYRATRSSLTESFGTPVEITSVDWNSQTFLTVSNDELILVMAGGYAATRPSMSASWSTPFRIYDWAMTGASLSGDLSKIYLSNAALPDPFQVDLYVGDFSATPPATPSPTPSPVFPTPVPDIDMAVSRDAIAGFTGITANPLGAAFDSQSRLVFFDQKVSLPPYPPGANGGSNQLLRATLSGGAPVLEALATQAQLATHDSAWGSPTTPPLVASLDVLSDDSIVMLVLYAMGPSTRTPRIERVIPGPTPQITTIASLPPFPFGGAEPPFYPMPLAADRSVTPNLLYSANLTQVYRVAADQLGVALSVPWVTIGVGSFTAFDLVIDEIGDVLVAGTDLPDHRIRRINKTTGAMSNAVSRLDLSLAALHFTTTAMAINPVNGDLFGLYKGSSPYPNTGSYYNVFRMEKSGSSYLAGDYVTGYQVFNDPDVSPFGIQPPLQLTARANAFAISPNGQYLYIGGGMVSSASSGDYYSSSSNSSFVRISTGEAGVARWTTFE